MELPHEITLSEDQKNPGKSKIVFTQDPGSFFYIVNTPPLPQNNKEDFNFEITENSLIIATKPTAKITYEAIVSFIRPISEKALRNVAIENHGSDGSFIITLRVSKKSNENNSKEQNAIKTFYKPVHKLKKNYTFLGNDTYGMKDTIDSMIQNGEEDAGKTLVGLMNSFNEVVSNPKLQETFNQTLFSTDDAADEASQKFNEKLQDILGPLNEAIDGDAIKKEMGTMNQEEFALNASKALEDVDNGNLDSLQTLLSSINSTKIEEDGKKASKKQMKDKEKKEKTSNFTKENKIDDSDAMQKNSSQDNENAQKQQKEERIAKEKQTKKDLILQDIKIEQLF